MKIYNYLCVLALIIVFTSCDLDNFSGPDGGVHGKFIDAHTGELVQQDIIRGTRIELTEHGYDPVAKQYLVVKNDGTYANTQLFQNTYTIEPVDGNFIPIEAEEVDIGANTEMNFEVIPYIRIKNVTIKRDGNIVIASFKIEQNVISNVRKIGMYVFPEPIVGEPVHTLSHEVDLNRVVSDDETFTLELDIVSNGSLFNSPKNIEELYFRVGALIDIGNAKFNYAPTVTIPFSL